MIIVLWSSAVGPGIELRGARVAKAAAGTANSISSRAQQNFISSSAAGVQADVHQAIGALVVTVSHGKFSLHPYGCDIDGYIPGVSIVAQPRKDQRRIHSLRSPGKDRGCSGMRCMLVRTGDS